MFRLIGYEQLFDSGLKKWRQEVARHRLHSATLSVENEVHSPHRGAVSALDVDFISERYLLSGGAQGTVAIHDLDVTHDAPGIGRGSTAVLLSHSGTTEAQHSMHKNYISQAVWYPEDSGAFVTASMDQTVKVAGIPSTQNSHSQQPLFYSN